MPEGLFPGQAPAQVDEGGVEGGDDKLDPVGGPRQHEEDARRHGVGEGEGAEDGAVDELADPGACVISEPEVAALGPGLPEVEGTE